MRRYLFLIFMAASIAGCSSPRYSAEPIAATDMSSVITIVRDDATRGFFLTQMESWCRDNGYDCTVVPDGTQHNPADLTLEYVSRWSWDFRPYLGDATISAYKDKRRVGTARYKASNNLNASKWGDDSRRIEMLLQILVGNVTLKEANSQLSAGNL